MYRNAVQYKGIWLAPGSQAFQLHQDKKFKELDILMKEVDEREKRLLEKTQYTPENNLARDLRLYGMTLYEYNLARALRLYGMTLLMAPRRATAW